MAKYKLSFCLKCADLPRGYYYQRVTHFCKILPISPIEDFSFVLSNFIIINPNRCMVQLANKNYELHCLGYSITKSTKSITAKPPF